MVKVSAIIPAHNSAKYIVQALESVFQQTFVDYEVIVVDDGSTDNTREVVQPYLNRLRYVWQPNQERSVARNTGIAEARGEFIALLDSDDVWLPEKLERQVAALHAHPEACMAFCPAQVVDAAGQPSSFYGSAILNKELGEQDEVTARDYSQGLPFNISAILPSTTLIRREALVKAGLFDPDAVPVEDWDMWIRLTRQGPFVFVPQPLCLYRIYGWQRELKRRGTDKYVHQNTYVINKVAREDPTHVSDPARVQAIAATHAYSALASYELGDAVRGQAMLIKASELDSHLAVSNGVSDLLQNRVESLWHDTRDEQQVLRFLDAVLTNLPLTFARPCQTSHQILSRVLMADVFTQVSSANSSGHARIKLNQVLPAIRFDPTWLRNRGVIAILARAIFASITSITSITSG